MLKIFSRDEETNNDSTIRVLQLTKIISTNDMRALGSDNNPKSYSTSNDILKDFFEERLETYARRKRHLEAELRSELEVVQLEERRLRTPEDLCTEDLDALEKERDELEDGKSREDHLAPNTAHSANSLTVQVTEETPSEDRPMATSPFVSSITVDALRSGCVQTRRHHPYAIVVGTSSTEAGVRDVLRCSVCERGFLFMSQFERHAVVHTGQKLFKCPLCPSSAFNRATILKRHMESKRHKQREAMHPMIDHFPLATAQQTRIARQRRIRRTSQRNNKND